MGFSLAISARGCFSPSLLFSPQIRTSRPQNKKGRRIKNGDKAGFGPRATDKKAVGENAAATKPHPRRQQLPARSGRGNSPRGKCYYPDVGPKPEASNRHFARSRKCGLRAHDHPKPRNAAAGGNVTPAPSVSSVPAFPPPNASVPFLAFVRSVSCLFRFFSFFRLPRFVRSFLRAFVLRSSFLSRRPFLSFLPFLPFLEFLALLPPLSFLTFLSFSSSRSLQAFP